MFKIQEDLGASGINVGNMYQGSDSNDTVRITVNSSDEGSRDEQNTSFNVDPSGVQPIVRPTLPSVQSIF